MPIAVPKSHRVQRVPAYIAVALAGCFWLSHFIVLSPAVVSGQSEAPDPQPVSSGPTEFCPGLALEPSFEDALAAAVARNKLILLIPSATKIDPVNGSFGPGLETFRADALADSRVVRLLQRRFVVLLFEMDKTGAHYNQIAANLIIDDNPELQSSSAMPTPPLFVVQVNRAVVGKVGIFVSADDMLKQLAALVDSVDQLGDLVGSERGLGPVEQATILYELRKPERAIEALGQDSSSAANFLRGVIAREAEDWPGMRRAFNAIADGSYAPEIEMQEIYRSWQLGNFQGIRDRVNAVMTGTEPFRYAAEALYYSGLAAYHLQDEAEACTIWEQVVRDYSDTLWGMKADRTRGLVKHGINKPIMMNVHPESLLGKRYLSPFGVPELKPRR